MSDEEPAPMSLKDRIARLKLDQVGQNAHQQPGKPLVTKARPPPPPPPRPAVPNRPASSNVPPVQDHGSTATNSSANLPEHGRPTGASANGMDGIARPALPPRTSTRSNGPTPSLPPRHASTTAPTLPSRRPSETPSHSDRQLSRRPSSDSVSSVNTTRSSVSAVSNATSFASQNERVRAPTYDPSKLPVLPPKRTEAEKEAYYSVPKPGRRPLKSTNSSPNIHEQNGTTPPPPSRPVREAVSIPSRPVTIQEDQAEPVTARQTRPPPPPPPAREVLPPPQPARSPRRSALELGMNKSTNTAPSVPVRPGSTPVDPTNGTTPPPIPTGSRPDLAALQASKPRPSAAGGQSGASQAASQGSCLLCRDFSGPDNHAARFPRESIPSTDVGWLAQQLCSPFESATDKARVIFTWLHHNIAYDVAGFMNRHVVPLKHSTPQSTITSGLAVCEGYAALFAAIAMKAGLEAIVVSGHGKGFGHNPHMPGQPIPPYDAGHAWNAVKIDNGQWKLIDPCWGAGSVCTMRADAYQKKFSPERFTQSNEDFGLDHFPGDSSKQYRSNGRVVGWEEYITGNKDGCGAQFFARFIAEEGFRNSTFRPVEGDINLAHQGPTVRFSFQKICPHWDPHRNGLGPYYLYMLRMESKGGDPKAHVPFETNGDVWWCDVPTKDLGRSGQTVEIIVIEKINDKDARGLTKQEYQQKLGRCGQMWGYVCRWKVA